MLTELFPQAAHPFPDEGQAFLASAEKEYDVRSAARKLGGAGDGGIREELVLRRGTKGRCFDNNVEHDPFMTFSDGSKERSFLVSKQSQSTTKEEELLLVGQTD